MSKPRIFLALPNNHRMENETWQSVLNAGRADLFVHAWREENSILTHCFNRCLVKCREEGGFDAWVLLHADMQAEPGFLGAMWDRLQERNLDALHAVVPIKNVSGLSSTAVAYSDDEWEVPRRITMRELADLPETFTIEDLQQCYDPNCKVLLPNTGCLMLRCGAWFNDFPGFATLDRVNGKADVVPEDWHFGFWAHRNGLRVGGTKAVKIGHWGRWSFRNDEQWGMQTDDFWEAHRAKV